MGRALMSKKSDRGKGGDKPIIVIRKEEVVEGGHHGGAWKVAYADFVTAMMAFFLLMWLLNATTEAQRKGLADYFSPSNLMSRNTSGAGKPFGGSTPYDPGEMVSTSGATQVIPGKAQPQTDVEEDDTANTVATPLHAGDGSVQNSSDSATGNGAASKSHQPSADEIAAAGAATEKKAFEAAANEIKQAIAADPSLGSLGQHLAVDMTRGGLRIQIMDDDKQAMFATGSADLNVRAEALLEKVAPVLKKLTESISIAGYTDAQPFVSGDRSNWELSADRANATRRFLEKMGLPPSRIASVSGNADRELLLPDQPFAAANRRIAIVVLRDASKFTGPVMLNAPPQVAPAVAPAAGGFALPRHKN